MYAEWSVYFVIDRVLEATQEFLLSDGETPDEIYDIEHVVEIDDEQIACANVYVNFCRELRHALDAEMHIEQPVPIDHITGESEATGTADCTLLPRTLDEAVIVDLKGGMYRVDAFETVMEPDVFMTLVPKNKPNLQLAMYASAALRKFDPHGRYKRVRIIIVQPRLNHISEYSMTLEELGETVRYLRGKSREIDINPVYRPSFETCHYCKGKSTCAEFQHLVLDQVFTDQSLTVIREVPRHQLGEVWRKLDLIDLFSSSVRSLVYKLNTEWQTVPGTKLVAGRKGNRKWSDAERAAQILNRDLGLPKAVTHVEKFQGPTIIDKLSKAKKGQTPVLNEFQVALISRMITQDDGKPVVVPDEDPRPALVSPEGAFSEVNSGADSAVSESPVDLLNLGTF